MKNKIISAILNRNKTVGVQVPTINKGLSNILGDCVSGVCCKTRFTLNPKVLAFMLEYCDKNQNFTGEEELSYHLGSRINRLLQTYEDSANDFHKLKERFSNSPS